MSGSFDLVSGDPRVLGGRIACIGDTTIPVSQVLGRLALGESEKQIIDWSESSPFAGGQLKRDGGGQLTPEGIRAAAAYGAVLTQGTRLPPPAEAALAETFSDEVAVEEALGRAGMILDNLAIGYSQEEILTWHRDLSPPLFQAAVAYAARLALDDLPGAPAAERPHETFLRDRLDGHDRKLVDDAYLYLYRTWLNRATPEKFLEGWIQFVTSVEDGHNDIYEEYALDLLCRDRLEDSAVTIVSPAGRERLLEVIGPWDDRFLAATYGSDRAVSGRWMLRRWWWYRIPNVPGQQVLKHLETVGIL